MDFVYSTSVTPKTLGFWRSRSTILAIIVVPLTVIALVYTVLFAGVTSHAKPTGSVTAVSLVVAEDLRLQGDSPANFTIVSALSRVDNHWAIAVVTPIPSAPKGFVRVYGFLHFSYTVHRWRVVTFGSAYVGCPRGLVAGAVPIKVLAGFGTVCPPTD